MEVRMQPRSEANQKCIRFDLATQPRSKIQGYRDHIGNIVHHFSIPGRHQQLKINAEATIEVTPALALPQTLPSQAWHDLESLCASDEYWDYLVPSRYAHSSDLLDVFKKEWNIERRDDPLTLLHEISTLIYEEFDYAPQTTSVDSTIDHALEERRGVCQDFAHVMIALGRDLGIPCRYVSGYLYHGGARDRSAADATHAWAEAYLPDFGWIGFDPTNNIMTGERHIRTAVGRDYADVPPTKGIFNGKANTELSVGVQVSPTEAPPPGEEMIQMHTWISEPAQIEDDLQQQQQQQQQQQ
jgi:transglutaminase-like putative cysteine protease